MKKRIMLCIMIIVSLCTSLWTPVFADFTETSSPFPDVPEDASYYEAVLELYELGIFRGDEKGMFNPDQSITRAETAKVICMLLDVGEEAAGMTEQVFSDVPSSHWAVGYVAKAAELGIINGYGDGRFGPSDPVTYEQVITMLVRAWGYEDDAIEYGGYPSGYVQVAEEQGISAGIIVQRGVNAPRKDVAIACDNVISIPMVR